MTTSAVGKILIAVGIVGLIIVYSFRPPSDLGDAFMMMGQGRDFFIKEPWYQMLIGLSVVSVGFGVLKLVKR